MPSNSTTGNIISHLSQLLITFRTTLKSNLVIGGGLCVASNEGILHAETDVSSATICAFAPRSAPAKIVLHWIDILVDLGLPIDDAWITRCHVSLHVHPMFRFCVIFAPW